MEVRVNSDEIKVRGVGFAQDSRIALRHTVVTVRETPIQVANLPVESLTVTRCKRMRFNKTCWVCGMGIGAPIMIAACASVWSMPDRFGGFVMLYFLWLSVPALLCLLRSFWRDPVVSFEFDGGKFQFWMPRKKRAKEAVERLLAAIEAVRPQTADWHDTPFFETVPSPGRTPPPFLLCVFGAVSILVALPNSGQGMVARFVPLLAVLLISGGIVYFQCLWKRPRWLRAVNWLKRKKQWEESALRILDQFAGDDPAKKTECLWVRIILLGNLRRFPEMRGRVDECVPVIGPDEYRELVDAIARWQRIDQRNTGTVPR
jgi:hypothetical protein